MTYTLYSFKNGSAFPDIVAYAREDRGAGGSGRYDYVITDASAMQHILGYTRDNIVYDVYNNIVGLLEGETVYAGTSSFSGTKCGSVSRNLIYDDITFDKKQIGKYDGPDIIGAAVLLLMRDEFETGSSFNSDSHNRDSTGSSYSGSGSADRSFSGGVSVGGAGGEILGIIILVAAIILIALCWKHVFIPFGAFWGSIGLGIFGTDTNSILTGILAAVIVPLAIFYVTYFISRAICSCIGKNEKHRTLTQSITVIIYLFIALSDCTQITVGHKTANILQQVIEGGMEFAIFFFIGILSSLLMKFIDKNSIPVKTKSSADAPIRKSVVHEKPAPIRSPAAEHDAKPSVPAPKPAAPVSKPSAPVPKPAAPVSKPSAPVQKPSAPVPKPATPAPKPSVPAPKPSASGTDSTASAAPSTATAQTPSAADEDVFSELERAAQLHRKGYLTDEEFEEMKAKLLIKI